MEKATSKRCGYVGQFSKFCLRQRLCAFKEFYMETRLSNIFRTTNITNLTKVIQQNSQEFYKLHPNLLFKDS